MHRVQGLRNITCMEPYASSNRMACSSKRLRFNDHLETNESVDVCWTDGAECHPFNRVTGVANGCMESSWLWPHRPSIGRKVLSCVGRSYQTFTECEPAAYIYRLLWFLQTMVTFYS